MGGCFGQILGQGSDSGSDFKDYVSLPDAGRFQAAQDHSFIDQKVLAEALVKVKVIAGDCLKGSSGI